MTQAEFARAQGWQRSYVTQLKHEGRLVMVDGRVDVEASLARIAQTRDPNRDDVARRNAQLRGDMPPGDDEMGEDADFDAPVFTQWRARKERALARAAELEYAKAAGALVRMDAVRRAGAELGALVRTALEQLPDRVAPEIAAARDESAAQALLVEAVEEILQNLAREIDALGQRLAVPA